jgi:hypothetical protein
VSIGVMTWCFKSTQNGFGGLVLTFCVDQRWDVVLQIDTERVEAGPSGEVAESVLFQLQ